MFRDGTKTTHLFNSQAHTLPSFVKITFSRNGKKPMKESLARRERRQPIPSGLAGRLRDRRAFSSPQTSLFSRLACAARPFCSVTSPLPKKFCDTFWEPRLVFHSDFPSVRPPATCARIRRSAATPLVYIYGRTSHSHRVIAGHLKVILKSPFRSSCFGFRLPDLSVRACAWLRRPSAKREGDGAASAAPSA